MASPHIRHVRSQAEMDTVPNEKSVVVFAFHAAWSAPCRGIAPFYSRLAATHRTLTFVRVEIDADNIQHIAQRVRLVALPTFIVMKSKEETGRIRGADRKGLEEMIAKHVPEVEPIARDLGSADVIAAGDESLLEYLDMRKVNCLNEAPHHPLKSIVETRTRNISEAYLESDADEQLLITLPFNQELKIRSVTLYTKDPKFGPKKIKIDINKLALGFDDVESAAEPTVIQVLEVSEELITEGKPIHLRFVRLQRVNSLHIFVESNHGNEDITRIDAIDVYGPAQGEPGANTQITGLRDFWGNHQRGMELLGLFRRGGDLQHLSHAIALIRESALLCPTGHADRAVLVGHLAIALGSQYEHQGDYTDLSEAITLFYEMLECCPPGDPHRPGCLSDLANTLLARYKRQGGLSDLEEAIMHQRKALDLLPPVHPHHVGCLINLTSALLARYNREGNLSDLEEAITQLRKALDLAPPGHPNHAPSINNLSDGLLSRYKRKGSLSDLEEAIGKQLEVLNLLPPGYPDRALHLNNLTNALLTRYERDGSLSDLEEVIERQREAVSLHSPGHPDRAVSLINLSNSLLSRYEREGSIPDLEEVIERQLEALKLRPPGHPDRGLSLNSVSNGLMTRYKREGSLLDLEEAIEKLREAVNLRFHSPSHPDNASHLNNLTNALLTRYGREGSILDLEEAIEIQLKALSFLPPGHPGRHLSLNSVSSGLMIRYQREGRISDLEDAIEKLREALNLHPPGHLLRATFLGNLSSALLTRYEREGSRLDLEEAIEKQREVANLHPPGHPSRALSLNNLSNCLLTRYRSDESVSDLEELIEKQQEALNLRPPGHPDRASSLGNLSEGLLDRYRSNGNPIDLEEAIEKQRETVDLNPPGHADRATSLSNLSSSLLTRHERDGSLHDLEEGTAQLEKALELRPHGHPSRSKTLISLSHAYLLTLNRKDGPSTMHNHRALVDKIFGMLREAVNHSNSPPLHRLQAALHWIDASPSLAPRSALDAYSAAFDQLDIVLATSSTLASRHSQLISKELARCKRLGVEAASCAVRQGDTVRAVEFLERGRNLLFTQIGRYRVELEELQKQNAELAKRFSDLSCLLDSSVVSSQPTLEGRTEFEDSIVRYRRVASDWERTVNDIRAVPGFENFLKHSRYTALQAAAAEGPIVAVLPDDAQSHALIILQGRDTPHYVSLPKASGEKLVTLCNEFIQAVQSDDEDDADGRMTALLRQLWVLVVGPIADALENELRCPLNSRIWWCPSSFLSFLPLHAAGRYAANTDPNQNLLARYVSSYTPTLQALVRARSKCGFGTRDNLLIVAQPDTPGQDRLLNALPEAELVGLLAEERLEMKTTLVSSKEGTHATVLDGIVHHSWIHLTCHGSQDPINPFDSCFYLYDKQLTLRDIMQRGLPNANFAFLAACHTATGDTKLLDEGLHLAAGLQFAGFKSVVGTIREVADVDGPVIAEALYMALQPEPVGEEGIDCSRVAHALSKAVQHLRDNQVPISRWIRHVHIGI